MAATPCRRHLYTLFRWGKRPINPLVIENRLHDLDKDLDWQLTKDGSEIVDLRIKHNSDEMLLLRQTKNAWNWMPSRIWGEKT